MISGAPRTGAAREGVGAKCSLRKSMVETEHTCLSYHYLTEMYSVNPVFRQASAGGNIAKVCRFCFGKTELLRKGLKNMSYGLIFVAGMR